MPTLKQRQGDFSELLPKSILGQAQTVKIPVVGLGGIARGEDAAEFLVAGASVVEVGRELHSVAQALVACGALTPEEARSSPYQHVLHKFLGGMAGSIGGLMFPIYSGRLLDRFANSGDINTGYGILFGICAFAYVGAFFLNHLLAPRFDQIKVEDSLAQG